MGVARNRKLRAHSSKLDSWKTAYLLVFSLFTLHAIPLKSNDGSLSLRSMLHKLINILQGGTQEKEILKDHQTLR